MANLQRARENIIQQVKVDVSVPPADNEAMAHAVSRSFICEFLHTMFEFISYEGISRYDHWYDYCLEDILSSTYHICVS